MNAFYIPEPRPPAKTVPPQVMSTFDLEIDALIQAPRARDAFKVDGTGLAAAVLAYGSTKREDVRPKTPPDSRHDVCCERRPCSRACRASLVCARRCRPRSGLA